MDEITKRCQSCESDTQTDMVVYTRYFHFYWVPFAPTSREAYLKCKRCGLARDGIPFDRDLCSNFEEIKGNFKRPVYTYMALLILGLVVLAAIIAQMLR